MGSRHLRADPSLRRSINRAWFRHLVVTEDEDCLSVTDAEHEPLTAAVRTVVAARHVEAPQEQKGRQTNLAAFRMCVWFER